MTPKLRSAIRQTRPFPSLEEEAFLTLQWISQRLAQQVLELLKDAGLTPTQYNVLRILRGAGASGRTCSEIGERMLTRDPDSTRLLDRLERQGLIARSRDNPDRRVVTTRITGKGLRLLAGLDQPLGRLHDKQLGHLGNQKLRALVTLLEEAGAGSG